MPRDRQTPEKCLLKLISQTSIEAICTKTAIVFGSNAKVISKRLAQRALTEFFVLPHFCVDQIYNNDYNISDGQTESD